MINKEQQIGGWLYILAVQMVVGVILGINGLFWTVRDLWIYETTYYNSVDRYFLYFVTYSKFAINLILLVIMLYLLWLFIKKHREFPKAYIYLSITVLVLFVFLDFMVILHEEPTYFLRSICAFIWLGIWGNYLLKSERVKQTFIRNSLIKYVKISVEEYETYKNRE